MKTLKLFIFSIFIFLCFSLILADDTPIEAVAIKPVILYEKNDASSKKLLPFYNLDIGDKFKFISEQGEWLKVDYNGTIGWIPKTN